MCARACLLRLSICAQLPHSAPRGRRAPVVLDEEQHVPSSSCCPASGLESVLLASSYGGTLDSRPQVWRRVRVRKIGCAGRSMRARRWWSREAAIGRLQRLADGQVCAPIFGGAAIGPMVLDTRLRRGPSLASTRPSHNNVSPGGNGGSPQRRARAARAVTPLINRR